MRVSKCIELYNPTMCSLLYVNYILIKFLKIKTIDPVPVKKPLIFIAENQEDPYFLTVKEYL